MNAENTDLFTQILDMEMTQENIIPDDDAAFCRSLKESLDKALDKIRKWYDILNTEVEGMGHDYQLTRFEDGRISGFKRNSNENDMEKLFRFEPFEAMTGMALQYKHACNAFKSKIICHFNDKYSISVKNNEDDCNDSCNILNNGRPKWEDTVQVIIAHLGGRSFRDTAEDEVIERFKKDISGWRGTLNAKLTGKTISLTDQLRYSDWAPERMDYDSRNTLDRISRALLLATERRIDGSYCFICGFNPDYTDFGRWYSTTSETIEGVKFYKNGKIDFRFKSNQDAKDCWANLRMEECEDTAS